MGLNKIRSVMLTFCKSEINKNKSIVTSNVSSLENIHQQWVGIFFTIDIV